MKAWRSAMAVAVLTTLAAALTPMAQEPAKAAPPSLDAAKLAGLPVFAGLTNTELDTLATVWQARRYPAGTQLITLGGTFGKVAILDQGKAEVHIPKLVIPLDKGALLGEMEYVDRQPNSADVTCATDCVLYEADFAALDRLLQEQPKIGAIFFRNMAKILSLKLRALNAANASR